MSLKVLPIVVFSLPTKRPVVQSLITGYYFSSNCVENTKNLLESVLKPLFEKSDQLKPLICGQRPLNSHL